jgi:hypothetical protein
MENNTVKEIQRKSALKIEWIFGIRNDIKPNIQLLDNETLVYPAAHYMVIYNYTKRLSNNQIQQFIPGTLHSKGFNTFSTINTNNKRFIAVVEEFTETNILTIYHIINSMGVHNNHIKGVVIDFNEFKMEKVYNIAFSQRDQNRNYLAAVGLSESLPKLIVWKWDSGEVKLLQTIDIEIPAQNYNYLNVNFSSLYNDNVTVSSDNFFINFTIENKEIVQNNTFYEPEYGQIMAHCYSMDGNLILATIYNLIVLNPTFEILQVIDTYDENGTHITSLIYLSEGIFAGRTGKRIENYSKRNGAYERMSHVYVENEKIDKDKIFDFLTLTSISNSSDSIIASTSLNDIISIQIKDMEKKINLKYLMSPFPSDSIEGLDICINKPYIITCSKDKFLRIYDYKKKNIVNYRAFDEDMLSVAYHPSGNYAIVAFEDKITPMTIYYDDINPMTANSINYARSVKNVKYVKIDKIFKWWSIFCI